MKRMYARTVFGLFMCIDMRRACALLHCVRLFSRVLCLVSRDASADLNVLAMHAMRDTGMHIRRLFDALHQFCVSSDDHVSTTLEFWSKENFSARFRLI
jgi:hypothetical protein